MIVKIENHGMLIRECSLPGEGRKDDIFPGHPNGIPLSERVWMLIYCTRGWRSVDDDLSVVYQLRRSTPDGELIKEGMLSRSIDDWNAFGDGGKYVRQHGHPCLFGVPKGAKIHGKAAETANHFVAKWRVKAKGILNPSTGLVEEDPEVIGKSQDVEWLQFRLNDREDDIEIVRPAEKMRQRGIDPDMQICSNADLCSMNQTFVQAIPFDPFATEWADLHHFKNEDDQHVIAPMRYKWDAQDCCYRWVETGPMMASKLAYLHEGSIARTTTGFILAGRSNGAIGWCRTANPFTNMPSPIYTTDPPINAPICLYTCADGTVRLFSGDKNLSPYGTGRNPLYCWEVDVQTLEIRNPREILDCIKENILPEECIPRGEMCKLLPHTGGNRQYLIWRVRTKNIGRQYGSLPPVIREMKDAHGLYYGVITYDRDYPGMWSF